MIVAEQPLMLSNMHALAKRGITVAERSSLYKFIGPPLLDLFKSTAAFL